MIIVIVTHERNERTGRQERIVSHGVDDHTGQTVILPCETPERIGAIFHREIGEYVLPDNASHR